MTEFDDVIRLLKEERPQATDLELDEIKQRVRRRAAEPSRRSQSMKSRLAILGMLVAGMVFSTAGASLALQGQSGDNAAISQYGTPTPTPTAVCTPTPTATGQVNPSETDPCAEGGVLPGEAESSPPREEPENAPAKEEEGGALPAEETQPTRQQAAAAQSGDELPFTGFAAVPILIGGLALLTGGLVLRRRTREH